MLQTPQVEVSEPGKLDYNTSDKATITFIGKTYIKRSRRNTLEEKRKMRKARKKRKRHQHQQCLLEEKKEKSEVELLRKELTKEKHTCEEVEQKTQSNKNRAISYWERWRHELDERKKLQVQARLHKFCSSHCTGSKYPLVQPVIPLINRSLLVNPDGISTIECYVGRGSFGRCRNYS